jgi:hypothetical protein
MSFAQRISDKDLSNFVFIIRKIKRTVPLGDQQNSVLKSLYTDNDSNIHIADAIVRAVMNDEISAYTNPSDSIKISNNQIQQILIDTKEYTKIDYSSSAISEIIIYENWYFDKKNMTMNVDFVGFSPTIRNAKDTAVYYPLFCVLPNDFLKMCKKYSLPTTDNTKKISLEEYFNDRQFKSRILKVKATNREWVYDSKNNVWLHPDN